MTRRLLLACALIAAACGVSAAQSSGPMLFGRLAVNQTHIAFSLAGDIWIVDRSGGEGQFITVRGLGPEFNTVLVNGRVMATDNAGREFSFDVLSSNMIQRTDVFKSNVPELQEGGIGATVNIITALAGGPWPLMPTPTLSERFVVSTISVSPSQRPYASPMYDDITRGRRCRRPSGMIRTS